MIPIDKESILKFWKRHSDYDKIEILTNTPGIRNHSTIYVDNDEVFIEINHSNLLDEDGEPLVLKFSSFGEELLITLFDYLKLDARHV